MSNQVQYAHDVAKFFDNGHQDVIHGCAEGATEPMDTIECIVDALERYKRHPDFPVVEFTAAQENSGLPDLYDSYAAEEVYAFFYNGKSLEDIKKG